LSILRAQQEISIQVLTPINGPSRMVPIEPLTVL